MYIPRLGSILQFFGGLQVNMASGDQIFTVIKNVGSTTASTGRAVMFEFGSVLSAATSGYTGHDGIGARLPVTTANQLDNPLSFAGIVVGADIASGSYGVIQQYGKCDYVILTGTTAATFGGGACLTQTVTQSQFQSIVLKPYDCFVAAGSTPGVLAVAAQRPAAVADVTTTQWGFVPGGHAQIAGLVTAATNISIATSTSTIGVKAFLRCI